MQGLLLAALASPYVWATVRPTIESAWATLGPVARAVFLNGAYAIANKMCPLRHSVAELRVPSFEETVAADDHHDFARGYADDGVNGAQPEANVPDEAEARPDGPTTTT
jgi:hypothetical protein